MELVLGSESVTNWKTDPDLNITFPTLGKRRLRRIQMYWTPNIRHNLTTKVEEYPVARPKRVFTWVCNDELWKLWQSGECLECTEDLIRVD